MIVPRDLVQQPLLWSLALHHHVLVYHLDHLPLVFLSLFQFLMILMLAPVSVESGTWKTLYCSVDSRRRTCR
jgi:hypothetical protein